MRKLIYTHLLLVLCLVFFAKKDSWAFSTDTLLPVDTTLAEMLIRSGKVSEQDSSLIYYKKALAIYDTLSFGKYSLFAQQRYFQVSNLWKQQLPNKLQAIKELKQARAKIIQSETLLANNHYLVGSLFRTDKQLDSAKEEYLAAATIYERTDNKEGIIETAKQLGSILRFQSKYDTALFYFQKSLITAIATYGSTSKEATTFYDLIARTYYNKGYYKESTLYFDTLLTIEYQLYGRTHPNIATSRLMLGNIAYKEANYQKALDEYETAYSIYALDSLNNISGLTNCVGNIGAMHFALGNFEKAEFHFLKAIAIKKARYGENSSALSYTYYNIGDLYAQKGDYQQSLDYFFKSVRNIKKKRGPYATDVAYVYNAIGSVYNEMNQLELAMDYYQKSIGIRTYNDNLDHPDTASDYDKIGVIQQKKKNNQLAIKAYKKALEIRKRIYGKDHPSIAFSYYNLASIHNDIAKYKIAKEYAEKSLAIQVAKFENHHPAIANTFRQLAENAVLSADYPAALNYYQQGLVKLVPTFQPQSDYDNPMMTASFQSKTTLLALLYDKGKTLKAYYLSNRTDTNLLIAAFNTLKDGVELADLVRQEYSAKLSKEHLLKNSFALYQELLEVGTLILAETAAIDMEEIFKVIEKSKSILLLENINDEKAKFFAGVPLDSLKKEQQLRTNIVNLSEKLTQETKNIYAKDNSKIAALEEKLFQLRKQEREYIESIEKEYPTYYQLKFDTKVTTIAEIQHYLPNPETALLEYSLIDSTLYVMLITQSAIHYESIKLNTTFFESLTGIQAFLSNPSFFASVKQKDKERQQYIIDAHTLYQELLAPILTKTSPLKELIIIPDGKLNYLPFEALLTDLPIAPYDHYDNLPYVLNDYTIRYEYAATLLLQNNFSTQKASQLFAGYAPVYEQEANALIAQRSYQDSSITDTFSDLRAPISPLQFNQPEVNNIAQTIGGEAITGFLATESAFKKNATDYQMLHLAMHGFVNDTLPNYSHLVFAKSTDTLEDRFLYAYELYNMKLNADLAVLSACETGIGKIQKGEGVMSLSRAFKYAGVPNIVMSLWKADDKQTKHIMVDFYQLLKQGKTKAEALKIAKLNRIAEAKDNKIIAHPFFWANFIFIGDGLPIEIKNNHLYLFIAAICFLLVSLFACYKRINVVKNKA